MNTLRVALRTLPSDKFISGKHSSKVLYQIVTKIVYRRTSQCKEYCTMEGKPLCSRINVITGEAEWVIENEVYDYHQEIARSGYTDMLHDHERNKKYYEGIRLAIQAVHARGEKAHVLDIGAGTGLLSMMAATAGADTVHACEAFPPIAEGARKIVAQNGFAEKIKVIGKRSTELTVGPDGDLPRRANILATEVFDTELIGEGAVPTFHHAHKHLLTEDCISVPHSATVYVQVIQSEFIWKWHKILPIKVAGCGDIIPIKEIDSCAGAASVHDVQLSQIRADQFQPITDVVSMIDFNFSTGDFEARRTKLHEVKALTNGFCHAVFMWWSLEMDTAGDIILSTAPTWAHPDGDAAPWRDHWMQSIYYLPSPLAIKQGENLAIRLSHDDYSLWFSVQSTNDNQNVNHPSDDDERPICTCGAHVLLSRSRIRKLNDQTTTDKFVAALKKVLKQDSICSVISDGSHLPLIAARLGAKKALTFTQNSFMRRQPLLEIAKHNKLSQVKVIEKSPATIQGLDIGDKKIDVVMGEPFFSSSLQPWHDLHFWYAKESLSHLLASDCTVLPRAGTLKAMALQFDHLWKFHAPVIEKEGFNLAEFDVIVQRSSKLADERMDPHHLWEYPSRALSEPFSLMEFDFNSSIPKESIEKRGCIQFIREGVCHGIAVWMDFDLGDYITVSTGLLNLKPNGEPSWDMNTKQGIYFMPENINTVGSDGLRKLHHHVHFHPHHATFQWTFELK
ncbi:protein arginine N-methyltransferase 7-like [Anneissia japonica]|uniref:protein arginine N-methyltransferase 7-like n=1 Tax=Anneissia japonica TaxID=1529436 RepID=UPI00142566D8|nr:protein arginine N-methyltransferase 7-like [Anneissia japonica]XP_033117181.1 protein arginine N-methyltransferase 7-like [Anneissia japonica]